MLTSADDRYIHPPRISREGWREMMMREAAPAVVAERDPAEYYDWIVSVGVDPLFIAAMFWHESQMGKAGMATKTKSWGNTRPPSFPAELEIGREPDGRGGYFSAYASWLHGCYSTVTRLIEPRWYYKGENRTIGQVFNDPVANDPNYRPAIPPVPRPIRPDGSVVRYEWAPAHDRNDPANYLNKVLGFMNAYSDIDEPMPAPPIGRIEPPLILDMQTHVNTWEPGQWPGRAACPVLALVEHVSQGTFDGGISWARNPTSRASFNYMVGKDGRIALVVDPDLAAPWANGIPSGVTPSLPPHMAHLADGYPSANWHTISIEHEGYYNEAGWPTDRQLAASADLQAWLAHKYGLPVGPDTILRHSQFSPRDRPNCPGPQFPLERLIAMIRERLAVLPDRLYFPETDAYLQGGFLAYWRRFEEAGINPLVVMGYPLTNEQEHEGRTIQVFERAVLVYHPDQASPWDIVGMDLGRQWMAEHGS